jgi:hypothetical protein
MSILDLINLLLYNQPNLKTYRTCISNDVNNDTNFHTNALQNIYNFIWTYF